ncbi:MAG: 30S ribosomal protein S17e [Nanoarchaeota archaeon]|nr:30S ribosomal protein S17e [Nanoarchaeota archaeon]
MGRIKTRWMKTVANELVTRYPKKFNTDFDNNKKVIDEMNLIADKIIRNKVAGYIVKLVTKGAQ